MYIMTSRGVEFSPLSIKKKSKMAAKINFLSYLRRHGEFDFTIIDMKKCKENKMATISMLQMVADYAKKKLDFMCKKKCPLAAGLYEVACRRTWWRSTTIVSFLFFI